MRKHFFLASFCYHPLTQKSVMTIWHFGAKTVITARALQLFLKQIAASVASHSFQKSKFWFACLEAKRCKLIISSCARKQMRHLICQDQNNLLAQHRGKAASRAQLLALSCRNHRSVVVHHDCAFKGSFLNVIEKWSIIFLDFYCALTTRKDSLVNPVATCATRELS